MRRVERERQGSLERGERELVRPKRALEWVTPQPLDEIGATDDDARLRPAEELVPGEADEIGSGAQALGRRRLVADAPERARAEIVHERQAGSLRDRGQVAQLGALREPDARGSSTGARAAARAVSGPIARS